MVRIIREHRAFAIASAGSRKRLKQVHAALEPETASADRVQTVRAGVLSHGRCRLGNGAQLAARRDRRPRCWWIPAIITKSQNIEQIVAWLLHHEMLGGFHFNDRRYADDDLTLGSIDPYQIFRIFHEIQTYRLGGREIADVAYMVDQSHNLKGKIEAMVQTVCTAQELYAKAAMVDRERLASKTIAALLKLRNA